MLKKRPVSSLISRLKPKANQSEDPPPITRSLGCARNTVLRLAARRGESGCCGTEVFVKSIRVTLGTSATFHTMGDERKVGGSGIRGTLNSDGTTETINRNIPPPPFEQFTPRLACLGADT